MKRRLVAFALGCVLIAVAAHALLARNALEAWIGFVVPAWFAHQAVFGFSAASLVFGCSLLSPRAEREEAVGAAAVFSVLVVVQLEVLFRHVTCPCFNPTGWPSAPLIIALLGCAGSLVVARWAGPSASRASLDRS